MEIKINIVEVASELAEQRMYIFFQKAGYTFDEFIDKISILEDGILVYKEEYQEEFNDLYDFYYNEIIKWKIDE